jgi:predicted lipoprotein
MRTNETMTVDASVETNSTQVATNTEQVQKHVMPSPTDDDYEAANLTKEGKTGDELVSAMENGQGVYYLTKIHEVMTEIADTDHYEKYIELFNQHQNSSIKARFRQRNRGAVEIVFYDEVQGDMPLIRCAYKPSKGIRMTIDTFVNGNAIRLRLDPVFGKDNDNQIVGFTPDMYSVLEYDLDADASSDLNANTNPEKQRFKSAITDFESSASVNNRLVRDFLYAFNNNLYPARECIAKLRPSRLRGRDDIQKTVRKSTIGVLGQ